MFVVMHGWFCPENRDDIFGRYDKQLVIGFKIHRDGIFGVEEDLVILTERNVGIVVNRSRNGNDSAGNGRDFSCIRERDAPFRFPFGFVFSNENTQSNRLDVIQFRSARFAFGRHVGIPVQAGALEQFRDDNIPVAGRVNRGRSKAVATRKRRTGGLPLFPRSSEAE